MSENFENEFSDNNIITVSRKQEKLAKTFIQSSANTIPAQNFKIQKILSHPFLEKLSINIYKPNLKEFPCERFETEPSFSCLQDYNNLGQIGSGYQSTCIKLQHKISNEYSVAKISKCSDNDDELLDSLKQECSILQSINHLYVVKMFEGKEVIQNNQKKFIQIMEFIPAKPLASKIDSHDFSESELLAIAQKLLQAVQYLHSAKIIMRDLNIYNVLYSKKKNILKVIDFGVAKSDLKLTSLNFSAAGNRKFQAPEMLKGKFYSEKIDIWGIGLILYSLLQKQIIGTRMLMKAKYQLTMGGCSDRFQELMRRLLEKKQVLRVSAEEALQLNAMKF